jgi:hypothetical protein
MPALKKCVEAVEPDCVPAAQPVALCGLIVSPGSQKDQRCVLEAIKCATGLVLLNTGAWAGTGIWNGSISESFAQRAVQITR